MSFEQCQHAAASGAEIFRWHASFATEMALNSRRAAPVPVSTQEIYVLPLISVFLIDADYRLE
jgi:hypothetical protein